METSSISDQVIGERVPLVRTAFDDDEAWQRLLATVWASDGVVDGDTARIAVVDDPKFAGAAAADLISGWPEEVYGYVVVADAEGMQDPEDVGLLVVDADENPGRSLRCAAAQIPEILVNLDEANLDFDDYLDLADGRVYRR